MSIEMRAAELNSLAAKLDGLDLAAPEQAILDGILERAAALGDD
ncbi:MAG: hypothetical protein ACE5GB_02755 [Acidimicrobiales bacterium]